MIVAGVALFAAEGETRTAVVVLAIAAQLNAFADHFGAILRGAERFVDEARLNTARALLIAVSGLGVLALVRSLVGLSMAMAVAGAGSCAYGLVCVLRVDPHARGGSLDRGLLRVALHEALPIWMAGLLSLLYFKVDTFFVRSFAGEAELGAYGAAYKLFEGAMLLPAVVLAVTFPQLVRTHDDIPAQRRLERRLGASLFAVGLLVGALFLAARVPLVRLVFGSQFRRAEDSLRVLALGLPLVYLNFGLTHFLIARHRERVNTVLAFLMLVVTVALDLLLIPSGSGPGAASATVLAEVVLTACCLGALLARGEGERSRASTRP